MSGQINYGRTILFTQIVVLAIWDIYCNDSALKIRDKQHK